MIAFLLCGNAMRSLAQQWTMQSCSVEYSQSELPTKIESVELSDTATIVSFTSHGRLSDYQTQTKEVYLCDEQGQKHYVRYGVGITMGKKKYTDDDGCIRYSLVFDSVDRSTTAFDVIWERYPSLFQFYGVHDSSKPLACEDLWSTQLPVIPEMKNIKTGKTVLKGQVDMSYGEYEPFVSIFPRRPLYASASKCAC